jgi:hypothetical protein
MPAVCEHVFPISQRSVMRIEKSSGAAKSPRIDENNKHIW